MIVKSKERGGGKAPGDCLLRQGDDEHVELHDLRCSSRTNFGRLPSRSSDRRVSRGGLRRFLASAYG